MSLRFTETDSQAELQSKSDFDYCCIVTTMHYKDLNQCGVSLESCHIFQRSTFKVISNCVENRVPINMIDHRDRRKDCLDYVTYRDSFGSTVIRNSRPLERVAWLMRRAHDDYRQRVRERLSVLFTGILEEIRDPELVSIVEDGWGLLEGK